MGVRSSLDPHSTGPLSSSHWPRSARSGRVKLESWESAIGNNELLKIHDRTQRLKNSLELSMLDSVVWNP